MSMYWASLGMFIVLFGLVFGAGAAVGLYYNGDSPRQCETFTVGVSTDKGAVVLGTVDLCGHDLEWGDVQQSLGDNT